MEVITVTFNAKGDPTVDVKGGTGSSCRDITKAVEDALGMVNVQTDLKPEAAFPNISAVKKLTSLR